MEKALMLAGNQKLRNEMSRNIKPLAKEDADQLIADYILKDVERK
jgi:hypothetical protein